MAFFAFVSPLVVYLLHGEVFTYKIPEARERRMLMLLKINRSCKLPKPSNKQHHVALKHAFREKEEPWWNQKRHCQWRGRRKIQKLKDWKIMIAICKVACAMNSYSSSAEDKLCREIPPCAGYPSFCHIAGYLFFCRICGTSYHEWTRGNSNQI